MHYIYISKKSKKKAVPQESTIKSALAQGSYNRGYVGYARPNGESGEVSYNGVEYDHVSDFKKDLSTALGENETYANNQWDIRI